jgi:hypothetical protein
MDDYSLIPYRPGVLTLTNPVGSPVAGTTTKPTTTVVPVTTTEATTAALATTTKPAGSCAAIDGQCGGFGFMRPSCCSSAERTVSNECESFSRYRVY